MDTPIQTVPQSRPGAAPARPRSTTGGARLVRCARQIGLLLGLLLAVVAAPPGQGFGGEEQAPESSERPVLDSSAPTAANWVVLEAVGAASWRAEGEPNWREFRAGEVLPPGCEIETGPDGEVMLVAGGDQLTVAPFGRLVVPQAEPGQDRRLRHERGRILVHIESRQDRDVRVKTPLLSLGIKGTVFEVDVDPEQNSVVVHEGEVEVTPPDGQDPVELGAGEGLRQPTAPGSPAARFASPPRAALPPAITDGAVQSPAMPDRSGGEAATDGERGSPADARVGSDRPSGHGGKRSSSPAEGPWGWADEWASSWAWVAIAGVALLFLGIPALALGHHLRERGRRRPGDRGRRRRELVRG